MRTLGDVDGLAGGYAPEVQCIVAAVLLDHAEVDLRGIEGMVSSADVTS